MQRLSEQQRRAVELAAAGKPDKTIAREMGVAIGTVKNHLRAAYMKLDVENRTQAAVLFATGRI